MDRSGVNLDNLNLSGANLSGTNLFQANLKYANLSGANLFQTDLVDAFMSGAVNSPSTICPDGIEYGIGIANCPSNS
jgi:uncharacterized protein YjbI with pentapeptide repeats